MKDSRAHGLMIEGLPSNCQPVEPWRRPAIAEMLCAAVQELSHAGSECPRLDAELLLMAVLGWSRERLCRDRSCLMEDRERALFEDLVRRRCAGEPAAYISGEKEFWSLDFKVCRDVLIPRPETERLVEIGLEFVDSWRGPRRILELGTGSGAVAISLAHERGDLEVWATDVSSAALRVARENAQRHEVSDRVHFLEGDLFEALRGGPSKFAAILSNPPYIASNDIPDLPRGVRDWEPLLALDGGSDGMGFHRRIISSCGLYLLAGGLLALEVGFLTAGSVRELLRAEQGFMPANVVRDYAGRDRVVRAVRRGH